MERERITISIKKKILDAIDKTIDGVNVRNRSHAIETLATQVLDINTTKNAAILIGGKDALKNVPAVQTCLRKLAENDFKKVYIALGYLSDKIKGKLGDGKEYGLTIKYIEEGEGSGGSTLLLKKYFDRTFLVINSFDISNLDLPKLVEYHKQHHSPATLVTNNLSELNGLYIFEPSIFDFIPKNFSMLETDVFPKLLEEENLIIRPIL